MSYSGSQTSYNRPDPWVLAFAAAAPLAYLLAFALTWNRVGLRDHDHALTAHHLLAWDHQLDEGTRQWTPLLCGGMHLAADPYLPALSPSVLWGRLLGPFAGLRLATFLCFPLGWAAAYLYAGLLTADRATRALAASLFIGNGFFVARYAYGHVALVPFTALPAFLLALHAEERIARAVRPAPLGQAVLALVLAGALALLVDGSPQGVFNFMPWLLLYAAGLSWARRSPQPLFQIVTAGGVAAFLDAAYLWPLSAATAEFPRLTPDDFVNPLNFLYFLLVPSTGQALGTRYMGHEATVFLGPLLAGLVAWHWRKRAPLPAEVRVPWALTAAVSFVLGMGSLRVLGWPWWLSPFDVLRVLPGFRSMTSAARYWGFLALPLSMLAALAVAAWAERRGGGRRALLALAMALQAGFVLGAIVPPMRASRRYEPPPAARDYAALAPEAPGALVRFVHAGPVKQSALVTPNQGVIDCYDNWERLQPEISPGESLVRSASLDGGPAPAVDGRFLAWSHIRLRWEPAPGTLRLVLNQAFSSHWAASRGRVGREGTNLALTVDGGAGSAELRFEDPITSVARGVSSSAWAGCGAAAALGLALAAARRR